MLSRAAALFAKQLHLWVNFCRGCGRTRGNIFLKCMSALQEAKLYKSAKKSLPKSVPLFGTCIILRTFCGLNYNYTQPLI